MQIIDMNFMLVKNTSKSKSDSLWILISIALKISYSYIVCTSKGILNSLDSIVINCLGWVWCRNGNDGIVYTNDAIDCVDAAYLLMYQNLIIVFQLMFKLDWSYD